MDQLTEVVFQVLTREWIESMDFKLYYQLQLVSKFVRATVNYVLPSQKAKHRFHTLKSETYRGEIICEYYVMPNGLKNGVSNENINGSKYTNFYLNDEVVFRHQESKFPGLCGYYSRHNFAKTIMWKDETASGGSKSVNTEIAVTWGEMYITYHLIDDKLSIHLTVLFYPNESVEETEMDHGYKLVWQISTNEYSININFSYNTSHIYSIVKDTDLQKAIRKASKIEGIALVSAMKDIAGKYGWKYLSHDYD